MNAPRANRLAEIAAQFGTPVFVYFFDDISRRVADLRKAVGHGVRVSYAVKANPNTTLLEYLRGTVDTLDVSSGGEVRRALRAGWDPTNLSFTGPAKTNAEIRLAIEASIGELVVESVDEAMIADACADNLGVRQPVLLRLAPDRLPRGFGVNMAGKPTQFGIDEKEADDAIREIGKMPHVNIEGFHAYSGTQCLDEAAIAENYEIFLALFRETSLRHDLNLKKVVLGSGIGIPYHHGTTGIDLAKLSELVDPILSAFTGDPRFRKTSVALETGRYLVGEAGIYVTRVLRVKNSRGTKIAICDGGMNHHLGACGHLGSVIHRNYPISSSAAVRQETDGRERNLEDFELVGPLCTSIDTLGHRVSLPALAPGDLIFVGCSGAYGLSASPIHFISHEPANEVAIIGDKATDISEIGIHDAARPIAVPT